MAISEIKTSGKGDPNTYRGRKDRIDRIVTPMVALCREHLPALVIIEGYAFGAKNVSFSAVELAAVLRYAVEGYADDFAEATPGQLKQFAGGRGNAAKAAVISSLVKRYRLEFASDNTADAFALAKLAQVVAGYSEPANQIQAKVAKSIQEQIAKDNS